MKTQDQVIESIERFRESFWNRKHTSRPPVGIYDENPSLPINFLRQPFTRPTVRPEDLNGDFVATEYEYSFAKRAVISDDFMAFAAPWRGIPWLEAVCGCDVRYSEGSLAPAHFVESLEELEQIPIPAPNGWLDCMRRETQRIAASAPPECWVSPSILRGTSDVLAAMRGMTEFFLDLHDNPQAVHKAASRVNLAVLKAIDIHYSLVQPKLGGYGHLFGHWAPSRTFMLQEDALGMCSPAVYREIFMPLNEAIVKHLGSSVFFHFHSTGHQHFTHVINLPGIAGLQMSMESIGPTLLDMVPVFQQILGKTRLMLQVCTGFEYLPEALRQLPHEGLYIIIPSKYIPTDSAFREFIRANFPQ